MRRDMSAAEWNAWRVYYLRRGQEQELAQARAKGG